MSSKQIYQNDDGALVVDVSVNENTVWLSLDHISQLFNKDKRTLYHQLNDAFNNNELYPGTSVRKFEVVNKNGKASKIKHYNLDSLLLLGCRVESQQGIKFRQWVVKTLRKHLLVGYTLNKQRLQNNTRELQRAMELIQRSAALPKNKDMGAGLIDIIAKYTNTFAKLQEYDKGLLTPPSSQNPGTLVPLADAKASLAYLKNSLLAKGKATEFFAHEHSDGLIDIWENLEQKVSGEYVYPTLESKAAHLLYFVVKTRPFSDGNKRCAALLFIDYLNRNNSLMNKQNEPIISDTALAAITLVVAESSEQEKNIVIRLIENFIA